MLYLVGLGLSDEKDITVRGLEVVKSAARVYLEAYTSILLVDTTILEEYYGRKVIVADREMVESGSDEILQDAENVDVAFLVVGDPYGATTHSDLVLRARERSIPTRSIPNASVLTAIGSTGLQLYNFGQTVSMVFFSDDWKPQSFHDRIAENRALGLHTLILLDIKVKEQSLANMARGGKPIYEPPRYMTVARCAAQMLEVEDLRRTEAARLEAARAPPAAGLPPVDLDSDDEEKAAEDARAPIPPTNVYNVESLAVGVARLGARDETIVSGTLAQLCEADERLGPPLHSLVLLGSRTHQLESDFLREFAVDPRGWDEIWKRDYEGRS